MLVGDASVTLTGLGPIFPRGSPGRVTREHDLSMKRIAQLCETTPHLASAAINTCHGGNFYDWVNSQRILAAKAALIESDQKIIDICYGVGFNSKSTFNTAFKKLTGCTPSEYRRRKTYAKQLLYKQDSPNR